MQNMLSFNSLIDKIMHHSHTNNLKVVRSNPTILLVTLIFELWANITLKGFFEWGLWRHISKMFCILFNVACTFCTFFCLINSTQTRDWINLTLQGSHYSQHLTAKFFLVSNFNWHQLRIVITVKPNFS